MQYEMFPNFDLVLPGLQVTTYRRGICRYYGWIWMLASKFNIRQKATKIIIMSEFQLPV